MYWTCSDPDGNSLTYDVYFGVDDPYELYLVSEGQSGTTYEPGTLSYDTTYYWQIDATDSYGTTTFGPTWGFTTKANSPPNTPSDPDPSNGKTNVGVNHDLSWTCSDPDGDSLTYDVYFEANDPTPDVLVSNNQTSTTYDPGTLSFDTIYYWKIKATDEYGATTDGPTWKFTTRENNPPDKPTILSGPTKGYTDEILTYSTVTTDPDGDDVKYLFDQDNGYYEWTGEHKSGETVYKDLSWSTPGTYNLTICATDAYGASSVLSEPLEVIISNAPEKVKWTYIFYMCCLDYNEEYQHQKIGECMKNVGSQNDVQFLLICDGCEEGDTVACHISPGSFDNIPLDEINPNWNTDELNMGDPDVLVNFSKYCIYHYPADRYSINLFGHGGSWIGCCNDDDSGNPLLLEELSTAFKQIKNKIGGKIDLVLFNSCLMNSIDVAYELSPYVKFQIGFETSLTMDYYFTNQYEEIFQHMVDNPDITPKQLAIYFTNQLELIDDPTDRSSCMSSIDLSKMQELVSCFDELAKKLIARIKDSGYREDIITARDQSEYIGGPYEGQTNRIIDLHDFVHNYLKTLDPLYDVNEIILCGEIMELIKGFPDPPIEGAVIKEKHTDSADFCNGLSIYFPDKPIRYSEEYEWVGIDFVYDTHWDEFLNKYYTYRRSSEFVENSLLAGISQVLSGLQSQPSSQQQIVPSTLPTQSTPSSSRLLQTK